MYYNNEIERDFRLELLVKRPQPKERKIYRKKKEPEHQN